MVRRPFVLLLLACAACSADHSGLGDGDLGLEADADGDGSIEPGDAGDSGSTDAGDAATHDAGDAAMRDGGDAAMVDAGDAGFDAGCSDDADGDGHVSTACGGDDCNDLFASVHPGAAETCNRVDDDCDGMVDEGLTVTQYPDADGDGFGAMTGAMDACPGLVGYVLAGGDCDDTSATINPGVFDACNGIDDNCDGTTDPGCMCINGTTQACGAPDGMGGFLAVGVCRVGVQTCVAGTWGSCAGAVFPSSESCNGMDDDCDGMTDEGFLSTYFPDVDADGYGTLAGVITACARPVGYATMSGDCDDTNAAVHPGAAEICDGIDDDCDGMSDPMRSWYTDADGDGYGVGAATVACLMPAGTALLAGDCNDGNALVHPGAPEVCNSIDDDCSGGVDDVTPPTVAYFDADGDGWGTGGAGSFGCVPSGWVTRNGDCNDAAATVHPTATETCNSVDDDCDGTIDGAPATTWCGTTPHATGGTCSAGTCSLSCASGFADCTSGLGCESDLATPATCGACTHACTSWTTVCTSGTCTGDAMSLAGGDSHNCAVRRNGTAVCWGLNSSGQLGDGTTTNRSSPVAVMGLTDAVQLAGGQDFTCARRVGGAVSCWGSNARGQLGDGTTTAHLTPMPVPTLTDAVEIAAGLLHVCARRAAGPVVCWGSNEFKQLGDGALHASCGGVDCSLAPVTVSGLSDATAIGGGVHYACALHATGAVACWGRNQYGQIGDGTTTTRATPVDVSFITDAVELGIGGQHACVRRSAGTVSCWGYDVDGQLGDGATHATCTGAADCSLTPVSVSSLSDAVEITAGRFHTHARRASGSLVAWGDNNANQIGDGTTLIDRHTPVAVLTITDAVEVSANGIGSCARRANDVVMCWGHGPYGTVGDGFTTTRLSPVNVAPAP